jgi:aspartyl-tRNA(Asn)/glutamyl-tRNA(Gln) amidotransferase subunit A
MNLTIQTLAPAIRDRRLSCVELLERCLARIDEREPRVRAWVLVDRARARAEAARRDEELKHNQHRGPLHGIPLGIKDIVDVFDWPTACGSKLWQRSVARQDAPVVTRLRQAGAVLIGKTVTTAYASFDPPPTCNPWNPSRTPGGSSSGSAAAVASGMCVAALGSQTGGSITRPASYCGVPACKPTYGAADATGFLPLAPSMDHPGPLARCIHDVALFMQTIADPPAPGLVEALDRHRDRAPVLGRARGLFERRAADDVNEMMDRVCAHYVSRGATVREVALPTSFDEVVARHRVIMAVEAAAYHGERLRRHPEDYPPWITGLLEEGLACPAVEYAAARELQAHMRHEILGVLSGIDALLCPATTRGAPIAETTGDPAFNSPWSFTGSPSVSLPTAVDRDGLPLGVQLIGPHGGEAALFAVAAWCEQHRESDIGEPPWPPPG